jgi:exosortase A
VSVVSTERPAQTGGGVAPGVRPRALASLAAVTALLVATQFEVWVSMVRVWATTTTYHHGFLILPIALFLIWLRRDALRRARPRHELAALPVLVGFGLLAVLGTAADVQLVRHVAAVGLLVTATVALLGREVCRPIWFPLLFLFFMVPAGDEIVPLLQDFVAEVSVALLRWFEIPVFHDGILITIPSGVFEVAEACAGIRFLIANIVVTALFAHLAFDRPWKWVVFLGVGVTVPIVANTIRAFGIIMIAHLTDGEHAVGVDHLVYGWGFFTAIMLVILWIGSRMADRPVGDFPAATPPTGPTGPWRGGVAAVVLAVVLAPAAYAGTVMRPPAPPPAAVTLAAPSAPGEWRAVDAPEETAWTPRVVGADGWRRDRFANGDAVVDVAQAYFAFERQGAELVYHGHDFAGAEGWTRTGVGRSRVELAEGALPVRFAVYRAGTRSRLVLWWYRLADGATVDPVALKLAKLTNRLAGRFPPASIVLVSTSFYDDVDAALARLRAFVAAADGPTPTVVD